MAILNFILGVEGTITGALMRLLGVIIGYLIIGYLKQLIEDKKIDNILLYLYSLISAVEIENEGMRTANKLQSVRAMAMTKLTEKEIKLVKKRYGCLDGAIYPYLQPFEE